MGPRWTTAQLEAAWTHGSMGAESHRSQLPIYFFLAIIVALSLSTGRLLRSNGGAAPRRSTAAGLRNRPSSTRARPSAHQHASSEQPLVSLPSGPLKVSSGQTSQASSLTPSAVTVRPRSPSKTRAAAAPTFRSTKRQCAGYCWSHSRPRASSEVLTRECLVESATFARRGAPDDGQKTPQVDITHVFNPFEGAEQNDMQYRWTMDSISAAIAYGAARGVIVEALAIHFTDETINVPPRSGICALPVLCPSRRPPCRDGSGNSNATCPLFSDVINVGYAAGRGARIVYTNYDIVLERDFYTRIAGMVAAWPSEATQGRGAPNGPTPGRGTRGGSRSGAVLAVSATRRDMIVPASMAAEVASVWGLEEVLSWPETHDHPGTDCLVLPRAFVPCLDLKHLHLGISGWGRLVYSEMRHLAHLVGGMVNESDFHLTRHLGRKNLNATDFIGGHSFHSSLDRARASNSLLYQTHLRQKRRVHDWLRLTPFPVKSRLLSSEERRGATWMIPQQDATCLSAVRASWVPWLS